MGGGGACRGGGGTGWGLCYIYSILGINMEDQGFPMLNGIITYGQEF